MIYEPEEYMPFICNNTGKYNKSNFMPSILWKMEQSKSATTLTVHTKTCQEG